jgi:ribonuclease R
MVHRLLKLQLALDVAKANNDAKQRKAIETEINLLEPELAWLARHATDMEREAEEATQEATRLKLVEFMSGAIGERFSAVITGVNMAGLYVREDTTTADGLIAAATLGEGFELDAARQRYHNPLTNKSWRLGQPLTVTLTEANPATTQLHFVIALTTLAKG